jgi:hypothetical protein
MAGRSPVMAHSNIQAIFKSKGVGANQENLATTLFQLVDPSLSSSSVLPRPVLLSTYYRSPSPVARPLEFATCTSTITTFEQSGHGYLIDDVRVSQEEASSKSL